MKKPGKVVPIRPTTSVATAVKLPVGPVPRPYGPMLKEPPKGGKGKK